MRIDLVITELDTGGAERCCVSLAKYLQDQAHQVRVIALGPEPIEPKRELHEFLKGNQIEIHYLGGRRWWNLPVIAVKLRRLLSKNPPDLIQSFLWHANVLSAFVATGLKIPLVGGVRVAEPSRFRQRIGGWAARRMAKIVCVSGGVRDWSVQKEGVLASQVVVIPNGISMSGTSTWKAKSNMGQIDSMRASVGIPNLAPILLFVGRLELQKGIDILIARTESLLAQLPSHHLVMIGDGTYRAQAEQFAKRTSVQGRVHVLGRRDDVRSWMQVSQLLILPSRYEGMPNVVLEAMSEGLPVVTMRVEGVQELLGESYAAQSVTIDDWQAFENRIVQLVSDREEREQTGKLNRTRALEHFDLNQMLSQYEALYRQI
jgi:glycosyltransferase involved in cell wall biosynthesis